MSFNMKKQKLRAFTCGFPTIISLKEKKDENLKRKVFNGNRLFFFLRRNCKNVENS